MPNKDQQEHRSIDISSLRNCSSNQSVISPPPSQGIQRNGIERERKMKREREIEREMIIPSFIPHKGLNSYKRVDTQGCKPPRTFTPITHSHLLVSVHMHTHMCACVHIRNYSHSQLHLHIYTYITTHYISRPHLSHISISRTSHTVTYTQPVSIPFTLPQFLDRTFNTECSTMLCTLVDCQPNNTIIMPRLVTSTFQQRTSSNGCLLA